MPLAPRAPTAEDRTIAEQRALGAIEALRALAPQSGPDVANAFAIEMRRFLIPELRQAHVAGLGADGAHVQQIIGRMLAYVVMSTEGWTCEEMLDRVTAAQTVVARAQNTAMLDLLLQRGSMGVEGPLVLGYRLLRGVLAPMEPRLRPNALRKIAADAALHPQQRARASFILGHAGDGEAPGHLRYVLAYATDDQMRAEAALRLGWTFGPDRIRLLRDAVAWAPYEQTRASALLMLAALGDGNILVRYRRALQWAREPQTRAKASLELGFLNDGDPVQRFAFAMRAAKLADTKAQAMLGLALLNDGDTRAGFLKPALALATEAGTKIILHRLLAQMDGTDAEQHERQAALLDASSSAGQKLAQVQGVLRGFPDTMRLIRLD